MNAQRYSEIYRDSKGLTVETPPNSTQEGYGNLYALRDSSTIQYIQFQNGPVPNNGANSATNEALLAILIHRLGILNEKFPCEENEQALQYMAEALMVLTRRTIMRTLRGVEGKMEV